MPDMDIITIGGITIDNLFKVNRLPKVHFEGEIEEFGVYFGGRAANVASIAAKLGLKTGIVAPVGRDFVASGYQEHLEELGVDLSEVVYYPKKSTQVYIFTTPKGDQITFFYKGVCEQFAEMKVPVDFLKDAKIVHITTSNEPTFNVKVAEVSRKNNRMVSFDPGNDPCIEMTDYLSSMISFAKLLFLNSEELTRILKKLDVKRAEDLLELGPSEIVIVEKVRRASIIISEGGKLTIPPITTRVVDPTGASDAYVAGFLTGIVKDYELEECAILGATSASFATESIGCQTNLPSWDLLLQRAFRLFGKEIPLRPAKP